MRIRKLIVNPPTMLGMLFGALGAIGFWLSILLSQGTMCERNCDEVIVVHPPDWTGNMFMLALIASLVGASIGGLGEKFHDRGMQKFGRRMFVGIGLGGVVGGAATPVLYMVILVLYWVYLIIASLL